MSTDISIDERVTDLAERSEFAALLFTWMIPHASDDRLVTANPRQLLMLVVPGFRWRSAGDVTEAIAHMVELELLSYTPDHQHLRFPEAAFYRHQSYIPPERRVPDTAQPDPEPNGHHAAAETPPRTAAKRRKTPRLAAEQRDAADSPQNHASVSFSVSGSGSFSGSTEEASCARAGTREAKQPPLDECERRRLDEVLRVLGGDFPDFVPRPDWWRKVLRRFGPLDLEAEAFNLRDWLGHHHKRGCSQQQVWNWLVKAEEIAAERAARRETAPSRVVPFRGTRPHVDLATIDMGDDLPPASPENRRSLVEAAF